MRPVSLCPFFMVLVLLASCGKDTGIPLAANTRAEQSAAAGYHQAGLNAEAAGQPKRALKAFRKVYEDYPLSAVAPEATFREAQILEQQGELLDAFEAYNVFLTKYPGSSRYASAIKRQNEIAHRVADGSIKNNFLGLKSRIDNTRTVALLEKVRDNAPRSPSASKAQFAIGQLWQRAESKDRAIAAYKELIRNYPEARETPEAQYQVGAILASEMKDGNPDPANIDRAKEAFDDLLLRYPSHPRAKDARAELSRLQSGDIQRAYDRAEFYRKKGNQTSALFYYQEVVRTAAPGPLRAQAQGWINQLSR